MFRKKNWVFYDRLFSNVNDTIFTISAVVATTCAAIVVVVVVVFVVVVWLLMSHICEALLLLMAIKRSLNTQKKRNETKTNVNHDFWSLFANNRIRKLQWAQIMRWTNLTHSFELRCMCFFLIWYTLKFVCADETMF